MGSRNATPQGLANAEAFAEAASNAGLCIVSGMASGVDAAAHRGGLRGSAASIAVVGTGLDLVYPAGNRELAHELAKREDLFPSFHWARLAIGSNFPRRNRIISGMSRGCLVVEAALRSGSLITARQALEQGREVFAVPVRFIRLFRKVVTHSSRKERNWSKAPMTFCVSSVLAHTKCHADADGPEGEESVLLAHLGDDITNIDTLCVRSGLTVEMVSAMLLAFELDGVVASLPGGRYQRLR